jgi:hypothetical protein
MALRLQLERRRTMPTKYQSQARYDAKTAYKVGLKLNRNTDPDLIELIEAADNKQALIKKALREYRRANEGGFEE